MKIKLKMSHLSPTCWLGLIWTIDSYAMRQSHNQLQHLPNEHSNRATISKSNISFHSPLSNILFICCNKECRHCHDGLIVAMLSPASLSFPGNRLANRKQQPAVIPVNNKNHRLSRGALSSLLFELVMLINSDISLAGGKGTYLKVFLCLRKLLYPYHCDTQLGATSTQRTIRDL